VSAATFLSAAIHPEKSLPPRKGAGREMNVDANSG
jgi:hypothetical protein